nr:hypothetical protein [Mesorhizobium sp. LNHC220B00]
MSRSPEVRHKKFHKNTGTRKKLAATSAAKPAAAVANPLGRPARIRRAALATATTVGGGMPQTKAKIRMYRQGLGDCFLVTLPRKEGKPYRILIDCGVILGTSQAVMRMTQVVDSVVAETNGHVDLMLATHQHWDHLSGFVQATESFKKLSVDNVWVAWTEDPGDELANQLRGERQQAVETLRLAGAALTLSGDATNAEAVDGLLGFFGAAGGASTEDALRLAMGKGKVRYCRPTDQPIELADPEVRLYLLGPPHDPTLIRKTLPSAKAPETYGLAARTQSLSDVMAVSDADAPFEAGRSVPFSSAQSMAFFRQRYWGPSADAPAWRRIDTAWLDGASELALALDSATNNTSLVLAIEFGDGDVLLFAADAQVGNWLSWQGLSWQVKDKTVTGPDLLARTVFYKVGHHGSHNATLRQAGLELMSKLKIAAIPVDHEMAKLKKWGNMPLPELLEALDKQASIGVIRIDQDPVGAIPGIIVDPLYFDIIF